MASHKAMIPNAYLLEIFICVPDIKPDKLLNDKLFKELVEFAAIAALLLFYFNKLLLFNNPKFRPPILPIENQHNSIFT